MKKLCIDETLFNMAFERDVDFHDDFPQSAYLDLETGKIFWVWESDEDAYSECGVPEEENRASRVAVEANPERYLEIQGRAHGEHHEIFRDFLYSDWTEDKDKKTFARSAYIGSIGYWKKTMEVADEDEIIQAWYAFREQTMKRKKDDFLREHGIEAEWK